MGTREVTEKQITTIVLKGHMTYDYGKAVECVDKGRGIRDRGRLSFFYSILN